MKKIIGFLAILILFAACGKEEVPDGVIEKQKMINVLFDMHITDAYLNQVVNHDTMLMEAHTRYNYIFKKNEIDSAKFSKSLNFYSENPKQLDEIYTAVSDSIQKIEDDLNARANMALEAKYNYFFYKYIADEPGGSNKKAFYNEFPKKIITPSITDTANKAKLIDTVKPKIDSIEKKIGVFRKMHPVPGKIKVQHDISTK